MPLGSIKRDSEGKPMLDMNGKLIFIPGVKPEPIANMAPRSAPCTPMMQVDSPPETPNKGTPPSKRMKLVVKGNKVMMMPIEETTVKGESPATSEASCSTLVGQASVQENAFTLTPDATQSALVPAADGLPAPPNVSETVVAPAETDNTKLPLKDAIDKALKKIDDETQKMLWARMVRKARNPDCPPLLKEKWQIAESKKDDQGKWDIFGTYLACGGNAGKMEAVEEMVRTDFKKAQDTMVWMDDEMMMATFKKREKVEDLKKRKESQKLCRYNPEFPDDDDCKQWKCLKETKLVEGHLIEKVRKLHWCALVPAETAMDMVKHLDTMFTDPDGGMLAKKVVSVRKGKIKIFDCKKYADDLIKCASEWKTIVEKSATNLGPVSCSGELVKQLGNLNFDEHIQAFCEKKAELPANFEHDKDGNPIEVDPTDPIKEKVTAFQASVKDAKEYLATADSMLRYKKKTKCPNEPKMISDVVPRGTEAAP